MKERKTGRKTFLPIYSERINVSRVSVKRYAAFAMQCLTLVNRPKAGVPV
ncbi:MAG: hypothetical protein RBR06_01440 [Desulfuromonadaceae bacterium]|nr:hypothetical protein [Desulfuromonadaceae bacterium]